MNFLLKIVQGPNAGAEIALPVGITVSLGKGDTCDIILSDASLADKACEFEVTDERIMMLLPDGKQVRMEPYRVQTLGTTAVAVGPGEGAWQPLVWPETRAAATDDVAEKNEDAAPVVEAPKAEPKDKKHRSFLLIGVILLLLLLLLVGVGIVYFLFPEKFEKGKAYLFSSDDTAQSADAVVEAPKPVTIADLATRYGLQMEKTQEGAIRLVGDFASRAERLKATAQLYRLQPGVKLDVTDAESLTTAIENVLSLVTDGHLRLVKVEGRTAFLKGKVASEGDLRRILEALSVDVPSLVKTDCSDVTLSIGSGAAVASGKGALQGAGTSSKAADETPEFPVVGVLTTPYPCLVLRDGSRILEGAHMGDYIVTSIAVDGVVLSHAGGSFMWRP